MFDKTGTRWDVTGDGLDDAGSPQANEWTTKSAQRGYTAVIAYTLGTNDYSLTITGAGAPGPSTHPSLSRAKNEFRKFLSDKPNS